jgi:ATP-binding cassette subfamily F protein uup
VPVKEVATKAPTEKKPIEKVVAEKMTYKEKLELDTLTKSMPDLEKKKAALLEQLNATNLDYNLITSISEELSNINQALELAEIRWLELSEKSV